MTVTKSQPNRDLIRKPFGILSHNKHVMPAMLEIYFAALRGKTTCGQCADISKGMYNLIKFTSKQQKMTDPLPDDLIPLVKIE